MHGFFSQFWKAECSCERSPSLSLRCSEFLEPQTGSESLQFFEVALPCSLSEGKSKELRGICVSHLGPNSFYTCLLTPVFGGMVNGFSTLTLNPSLCVRAQGLLLIYWHWWPCPFSSGATPTQVRGEADRRERETKELSWRGGKLERWQDGACERQSWGGCQGGRRKTFTLTLFSTNCSYQERGHSWWQQIIERLRVRNTCINNKRRKAVWFCVGWGWGVGGGARVGGRGDDEGPVVLLNRASYLVFIQGTYTFSLLFSSTFENYKTIRAWLIFIIYTDNLLQFWPFYYTSNSCEILAFSVSGKLADRKTCPPNPPPCDAQSSWAQRNRVSCQDKQLSFLVYGLFTP